MGWHHSKFPDRMWIPTLNVVSFLILQIISLGGLSLALLCYAQRHIESSRSPLPRRFTRHLWLFGHGIVFQVSRVLLFFGIDGLAGATVAQMEAFRTPMVALSLVAALANLLLVLSMAATVVTPNRIKAIDTVALALYACTVIVHLIIGAFSSPKRSN